MKLRYILMGAACGMFMLAGCNSVSQQECCCNGTDKVMAVQLYSVRDLIGGAEEYAARHEEVLKALADMGYTGVEAAHYGGGKFYGVSPEQFKADVEAAGMEVVSSHVGHGLSDEDLKARDFTKSLAGWDELIAAHKAAGMEYIVCPWMDCDTLDELKFWCEYFNAVGKKVKDAGMKFGYHNHSHEMREIEGKIMIEYMLENTDPELVFYQMFTGLFTDIIALQTSSTSIRDVLLSSTSRIRRRSDRAVWSASMQSSEMLKLQVWRTS